MKILFLSLMLISTAASASDLCAVSKIYKEYQDTALIEHDGSDDEYAFIGFDEENYSVRAGGYSYSSRNSTEVTVEKNTAATLIVYVARKDAADFIYKQDNTIGCASLSRIGKTGKQEVIAVANCVPQLGNNPRCGGQPNIEL